MTKTLVAQEQPLSKIFSDDYVFRVPGYQRPYAWTTEHAGELFDDLRGFMEAAGGAVESMPPYFLGSIVLIKDQAAPEADVVDGQQRLTTLTVLLAAIRASVGPKSASEVTPLLYEKGSAIRGTRDRFRLTLRERDSEFFQRYVQREDGYKELVVLMDELSDSQSNIRANARLFQERLNDLNDAERLNLAQFIVTRCYIVVVATPDIDSAYRIFSVLNSRGLDLSATDILKAEIIGNVDAAKREFYTNKWEEAEENLGRDGFGDLFSHIRMIYRKAKPKSTLLKEFKEHVPAVSQPAVFVDTILLPMVKAYDELVGASYESTQHAEAVNELLRWLNRLEFADWVPPALAYAIRNRQHPPRMLVFLCDLERLAYAMLIRRAGVNERIDRFSRLTTDIEQGTDLFAEGSALQLSPEEQHQVYAKLDGQFYELLAARARSAVLLRLDALLSAGGATYDYARVTVEHVLPQAPRDGSVWVEWFPDVTTRATWTHRIGNLALLTRNKNSAASNYDFATKKQKYFSHGGVSPFVLTTQVLSNDKWTQTILENRQREVLSKLEKHWRLQKRADAVHPGGLTRR